MSVANRYLGNTTEFASPSDMTAKYGPTVMRFYLQSIARNLLTNHRIQVCWRYPLPGRKEVDIIYSDERKRARTEGTMKCGSAWCCNPCSMYIGERRRLELGTALERSRGKYIVVMVTYTSSHSKNHRLKELLHSMSQSFRWLKSGRFWQTAKEEFALMGSVRSLEITWGVNGWHPHYHELVFVDVEHISDYYEGSISEYAEGLEVVLSERWIKALKREGLTGSESVALRVSCADKAASEYIAKYSRMPADTDFQSQADEVSRGMSKTARGGNLSVWEILFHSVDDRRMRGLFLEYEAATKGRSQLQWSRGLKTELDIDIIRDELSCEGIETETDRLLAKVPMDTWRYTADRGYLPQLMTYANTGEAEKVKKLIAQIEEKKNGDTWVIPQFDLGH